LLADVPGLQAVGGDVVEEDIRQAVVIRADAMEVVEADGPLATGGPLGDDEVLAAAVLAGPQAVRDASTVPVGGYGGAGGSRYGVHFL
jgi:hypothetical protein